MRKGKIQTFSWLCRWEKWSVCVWVWTSLMELYVGVWATVMQRCRTRIFSVCSLTLCRLQPLIMKARKVQIHYNWAPLHTHTNRHKHTHSSFPTFSHMLRVRLPFSRRILGGGCQLQGVRSDDSSRLQLTPTSACTHRGERNTQILRLNKGDAVHRQTQARQSSHPHVAPKQDLVASI